jgi:hypothetical protein
MPHDSELMPEQFIAPQFPKGLKVKDLKPEHGEGFIGFEHVEIDKNRVCWVLLDAPVRGADYQTIAFISIRRTGDGGYQVRFDLMPSHLKFHPTEMPDPTAWTCAKVFA